MSDYFALFDAPRRPWLDAEALKTRFLDLSAETHPDRVHQADAARREAAHRHYADLNAAYRCLCDPKERLAHLLQLELGSKPGDLQEMPAALADIFLEVARLCRQADAFLAEKERTGSPLLQAQWFARGAEWVEKLEAQRAALTTRHEALLEKLKVLDAAWGATEAGDAKRSDLLREMEELYRLLSFFARWKAQVQERLVRFAV